MPCGLASDAREMRSLSECLCARRRKLLRLGSSAQTFFFPATCDRESCTLRTADHAATNFKKSTRGSVVVKSVSIPASVAELSDPVGRINLKCLHFEACNVWLR